MSDDRARGQTSASPDEPGGARRHGLFRLGWMGTSIWLAVAAGYQLWIAWPCVGSQTCEWLRLGEFGDFFAGVFAPLAFLWFVIAVFMQKEELQLQREELHALLEEQRRTSVYQAWRAQPNLVVSGIGARGTGAWCELKNAGATVSRVGMGHCSGELHTGFLERGLLRGDGHDGVVLKLSWSEDWPEGEELEFLEFEFEYDIQTGERWRQAYRYMIATKFITKTLETQTRRE